MHAAAPARITAEATVDPAASPPCWSELADHACEPNPFYHPALLQPALTAIPESLAENRSVRILEARDGQGMLVGSLPVVQQVRHGRLPVSNVANWMHDQCFYGAPLLRKGHEEEAWGLLLAQLDSNNAGCNFLHLRGFDTDGPAATALASCCAKQRRAIRLVTTHERAMLRSRLGPDEYWTTHVRSKKRKEIRRLSNRLSELGQVTHARLTADGDVGAWARAFLALERSGWKGDQGTSLDSREETRSFFMQSVANAATAGMLDMLRIDVDGAPIAMLVNFRMGTGAFSYKIAFDERFARFSPGILIEIDNLHAVLGDPTLDWMDSCAAPNHPMIDGIWAERRTIGQYRIALNGRGASGLKRRATFAALAATDRLALARKGKRP